jgi:hypothetical protein
LDEVPTWIDLPQPRELDAAERELLAALLAYASCDALTEQATSVRVTATCSCGCSSVRLRSDGEPLPAAAVRGMSSTGRDDYVAIGATSAGEPVADVRLHVLSGAMGELELYAGDGVPMRPPAPDLLSDFEII